MVESSRSIERIPVNSEHGANVELVSGEATVDPVSGSVPHRADVAQAHRLADPIPPPLPTPAGP